MPPWMDLPLFFFNFSRQVVFFFFYFALLVVSLVHMHAFYMCLHFPHLFFFRLELYRQYCYYYFEFALYCAFFFCCCCLPTITKSLQCYVCFDFPSPFFFSPDIHTHTHTRVWTALVVNLFRRVARADAQSFSSLQ